jgi:molecular chaperone DnaK
MARDTIDYGIDLGTTNSSIAVLADTMVEVIPTVQGSSFTPSAVWFDKRGEMHVGLAAKARSVEDEENVAVEFKLRMGQELPKLFRRSGRSMKPEEMSAEVLKSLKTDVRMNKGEDLRAAVITVPAAFELPQCEATRKAGELAGFSLSPLLQEPVAAALAYGFQSAANKVFWLVYDFGGGTFDAAVIQVRDGIVQVVNHAGDNYLGGKNVDWDIVEKLLIPQLQRERHGSDFPSTRETKDPKWKSALAKLKYHAEEAKIKVSRTRSAAKIWIENLYQDDRGEGVDFACELTPADVQQIIDPWVTQSINLCQKALAEKRLSGPDIEKVVMVGGSSLFPWLQDRVAGELSTRLDFSVDPMTAVSRGAAIFAGTQRIPRVSDEHAPLPEGTYEIQLEYEPIGSETDPMVGGRITPPAGASVVGLALEIVETRSKWRSGAIRLSPTGTFMTEVHAEKGRKCEFQLTVTNSRGVALPCSPDRFVYTVGMVITSPPAPHNVGVAMTNNKPKWFTRKGESLPARATQVLYTTVALQKDGGDGPDNVIRIPVIEGTNDTRADRNRVIGNLEILPSDPRVRRNVPMGSEIEVTLELDASWTTTTKAFVGILDEQFAGVFKAGVIAKSPESLRRELNQELDRLIALKAKANQVGGKAKHAVDRLENEQIVAIVERQIAAAHGNPEARGEADRKLLDLKACVDAIDDELEWPDLVRQAREQCVSTREVVEAHGSANEKARIVMLVADVEQAIAEERIQLLRTRMEDLRGLSNDVVLRQPSFWIGYLEYLQDKKNSMTDLQAAQRLFAQGQQAIADNDVEALKAAVRQLIRLQPKQDQRSPEDQMGIPSGVQDR